MRASCVRRVARLSGVTITAALLALAAGCRGLQTATPTDAPPSVTLPTPAPTPERTQILLISSAEPADALGAEFLAHARSAAEDLAVTARMHIVEAASLPGDEAAEVALVIGLPPDPGLQVWAGSHPEVRIVSLGIPGMQPAPNLWAIASDGLRYDQLGFALGYLAAMVTPEYRLGALPLDASTASLALTRGFVVGGTYYCGLCNPVHPPYLDYPLSLERQAVGADAQSLSTLLVAPRPQSLSEIGLPGNAMMMLVGVGEPSGELRSSWIASADFDVAGALASAWTQIQGGQAGMTAPLGIRFHSVDAETVSEGRLRLAEALLPDLTAGVIDTGVDPLTGELR